MFLTPFVYLFVEVRVLMDNADILEFVQLKRELIRSHPLTHKGQDFPSTDFVHNGF